MNDESQAGAAEGTQTETEGAPTEGLGAGENGGKPPAED